MRKEINENDLNQVSGGEIIISSSLNAIKFTTLNEAVYLKNGCTARQAHNYVLQLMDENPNMSEAQFDAFVKKQFKDNGWI